MRKWLTGGLIIIALLLMFGAAGFDLGQRSAIKLYESSAEHTVAATNDSDPISEFRTERQQLRQMQISQLNEIIHGGNAAQDIINLANTKLIELMQWSEQETTLEGLLRLREFEDVLVTVHTGSVNVMVRAESLTQQQCTIIMELVVRETGISSGNVKIIPIN